MGMREKLIELIGQVQDCGCDVTDVVSMNYVKNDAIADYLIANGVTFDTDINVLTKKISRLEKSNRNWRRKYQRLKATRKVDGERKTDD